MNYLTVPNWKKHQHRDLADKGNMPWFKLESGIFDDHAVAQLTAAEFRAYIRALTLAARTGNKLLAEPGWLRAHFGTKWRSICATLIQHSLLEDHSGALNPPQTGQLDRATDAPTALLEERRQEKEPLDVTQNEENVGTIHDLFEALEKKRRTG